MRAKGICFDTGFLNRGVSTRPQFDERIVRREMEIIRRDLHCTAVRITGGDVERLKRAATFAADAGLEVWISPFTTELTADEFLAFLADCADHAERLRTRGAEVVLLTGSELSLFTRGILPGDDFEQRIENLQSANPEQRRELLIGITTRINDLLRRAVETVRARFGGKISYASIPIERVDWSLFDFVATDAGYRSRAVADGYRDSLRAMLAGGRPVAITEFGCCTYRGAADAADKGAEIVEWDRATVTPLGLKGEPVRDESEQVACLSELVNLFEEEGVDTAFWHNFAAYYLPHRPDPRQDLDMASMGVVKVLEDRPGSTYADMPWEPKAAFAAMAERYGR